VPCHCIPHITFHQALTAADQITAIGLQLYFTLFLSSTFYLSVFAIFFSVITGHSEASLFLLRNTIFSRQFTAFVTNCNNVTDICVECNKWDIVSRIPYCSYQILQNFEVLLQYLM